jgi:hypothetical protein
MKKLLLLIFVFLQTSCSEPVNLEISKDEGVVELSTLVPGKWDRLCVLGPYSSNKDAKELLGFEWDLEEESSISTFDSFTLLVFVAKDKVEQIVELSREADFASQDKKCFDKSSSQFNVLHGQVLHIK